MSLGIEMEAQHHQVGVLRSWEVQKRLDDGRIVPSR